jgi:thioesterase domain-containing protein
MVAPNFDMNSLVAHVVEQIKANAPLGPLLLAGYSLGGHVAYLAAEALVSAGRSIRFLGILDTGTESPPASPISGARRLYHQLQTLLSAIPRKNVDAALAGYIARRLTSTNRRRILQIAVPFARVRLPVRLSYQLRHHLQKELQLNLVQSWLSRSPSITPQLDVPTVLFRSDDDLADYSDDLGWRKLCPNLTITPVLGNHHTMFETPNLEILCDRFISAVSSKEQVFARYEKPNPSNEYVDAEALN